MDPNLENLLWLLCVGISEDSGLGRSLPAAVPLQDHGMQRTGEGWEPGEGMEAAAAPGRQEEGRWGLWESLSHVWAGVWPLTCSQQLQGLALTHGHLFPLLAVCVFFQWFCAHP